MSDELKRRVRSRLSDEDERMLKSLLAASPDEDEEVRFQPRPFREMLERGYPLSERQRAWLHDVYERIVGEPQYVNMASSGKLARGREVTVNCGPLPKRPPQRRSDGEVSVSASWPSSDAATTAVQTIPTNVWGTTASIPISLDPDDYPEED